MADNIDITSGSGKTVATDEVSGTHYQRVKIGYGADGSYTDTDTSNRFPVASTSTAEGATSDAAVVTDTTGTVSGKLRGLVKWAFERMPASLGQKAKAASFPVVLASDMDGLITDNATFTASATKFIGGLIGVFQATVTSATAGKISIARISQRRAVVTSGDSVRETAYNSAPTAGTSVYVQPSSNYGAREYGFYVQNSTGLSVTVKIAMIYGTGATVVYSETIANGQIRTLAPAAAGLGADARYIPVQALGFPVFGAPVLECVVPSGSISGNLRVDVGYLS